MPNETFEERVMRSEAISARLPHTERVLITPLCEFVLLEEGGPEREMTIDLSGMDPKNILVAIVKGAYEQGFIAGKKSQRELTRQVLGLNDE